MRQGIQLVGEQFLYVRSAKLARRQADAMNDDKLGMDTDRPPILILRQTPVCRIDHSSHRIDLESHGFVLLQLWEIRRTSTL